jgi:hypothetical protein
MLKEYRDETTVLEVNLLPPSLRAELRRLQGIDEVLRAGGEDPILLGLSIIYPSLIAATPAGKLAIGGEVVAWPPAFEQCLDMSRAAFDQWTEWVFEANPGWKPMAQGSEEQEKKVETRPGIEQPTGSSS